jgi:hypothetical protein
MQLPRGLRVSNLETAKFPVYGRYIVAAIAPGIPAARNRP